MLISLLLLSVLPLSIAHPQIHPQPNPVIDIAPEPTPLSVTSTTRGIKASLTHGAGTKRRANGYTKAKRDSTLKLRHRQKRHSSTTRSLEIRQNDEGLPPSWLLWAGARLDSKYNSGSGGFSAAYAKELTKRADNGDVQLTNHNLDTSYSATLSVGTPSQSLDIVLDTGSSDLWVASGACKAGACTSMTTFDTSQSTSNVNLSSSFSIEYGSGTAAGSLVQDLVTLGGYSVAAQTFASCNQVSTGLLSSGVSGIMGLSWQALAYSKATPWWITLAKSSSWSEPLFAFHLARYRNVAGANPVETDGGVATFGFLDSSLYSGDVTYVSVSGNAQYWQIPMASMTMQGKTVSLGSSNMAAIDTGTTLIGGPEAIITAIYDNIPGSQRMTGSYAPYFAYPCSTNVDFEITFGGFTIKITDQDFNLGRYTSDTTMCTGAAYVQTLSSSSPVQWIVGDAALKNTYTVFRYSPAAVGFANLAGSISSSEAAASTTIPDVSALAASTAATPSGSIGASASSQSNSAKVTSSTGSGSSASNAAQTGSAEAPHVVTAASDNGSSPASETASGSTASATSAKSAGSSTISLPTASIILLGLLGTIVTLW
ncbi:uncharacterized protein L201_001781 [Kwoniella dendrophila CBS 6074]|uniref:Peptidase A1 domain-containing protein n=1 Tax=Kwoniella dendrophila CBS 6074 TaxID=1295534 RepID=A0AAX4JNB5_9TREE